MLVKFCLPLGCLFVVSAVEGIRGAVRRNFATKSRYHFYAREKVFKTPWGCNPLHLNMVFRHGTRYPGKKDLEGFAVLARDINQFFNNASPKKFGKLTLPWTSRFYYGDKMLAKTGNEEMYNISKRMLKRFPSLFNPRYYGERHFFVSTMTSRTSQSASAFAFGLFEGKGHLGPSKFQPVAITTTGLTDPVLRFFDICAKYKREVSKNKAVSLMEFHKFRDGPEMENVRKAVANRLNISEYLNISADHVQHMFLSCAYKFAIHGNEEWCSVFEEDELDVVEYLYDIKNYWKRGYGFKINYKISCLLLKNLTESIQNAVNAMKNSDSHTQAIFHFAHAETMVPLLCIMGLYNDSEPLLASNYHRHKNRQFQTSNMVPFSANVAMVLYSCEQDYENHRDRSFYIEVLVNEQVTALPCCDGKELCPLQQFLSCFGDIDRWCDFSKICDIQSNLDHHNEL